MACQGKVTAQDWLCNDEVVLCSSSYIFIAYPFAVQQHLHRCLELFGVLDRLVTAAAERQSINELRTAYW